MILNRSSQWSLLRLIIFHRHWCRDQPQSKCVPFDLKGSKSIKSHHPQTRDDGIFFFCVCASVQVERICNLGKESVGSSFCVDISRSTTKKRKTEPNRTFGSESEIERAPFPLLMKHPMPEKTQPGYLKSKWESNNHLIGMFDKG